LSSRPGVDTLNYPNGGAAPCDDAERARRPPAPRARLFVALWPTPPLVLRAAGRDVWPGYRVLRTYGGALRRP
jgi:hypothetical protein